MPIYSEVENALKLLDDVQKRMSGGRLDSSDPRMLTQVNNDLNTLLSVLSNPMFQKICKIQDSVGDLGTQLVKHPSITPNDFDISTEGKLVLKISPVVDKFRPTFDKTPIELKKPPVKPVPTARAASSPPLSLSSKKFEDEDLAPSSTYTHIPIPNYIEDFDRVIADVAVGREVHKICLCKPEGSSLGFSVVGLKSQERGELGIFVQEIQATGLAAKDGRLAEGDQILAIDGQPLDAAITHQQAIGILQQARGEVEIVVARTVDSLLTHDPFGLGEIIGAGQQPPLLGGERPTSPPTEDSKGTDMVLNTEYAQVEVIELINDGTGLGFGIIGGRSTGVVVKTILPGGVADRDGRLQSGDHILQIGEVNLLGMGSEQVAAVLRQCGSCVRLVVARPIEPTSPDAFSSGAPIVPTRILGDPEELERHLLQANGYSNHLVDGSLGSGDTSQFKLGDEMVPSATFDSLPEVELVDVELKKDSHGLGITIAGYVCEKEELSGIFVKSISEGSAADLSGKISINDRIVEVDGLSLQGFTNHQAVEVLRKTGPVVMLKLERYHHGTKYDQLQSAISHSEHKPPTPSSVSALSLPQVAVDSDGEGEDILATETGLGGDDEEEEEEMLDAGGDTRNVDMDMDLEDLEMLIDTRYEGEMLPTVEAAVTAKWTKIMGPDCQIVVSQLSKAREGGGLGISLEGTVDVEDGREVRPHHYIRSILPDGPVGRAEKLQSGDELLDVNGRRLLGLNHVEVVSILKDLPTHVRIVCARRPGQPLPSRPIDTSQDRNAFAGRNILGGSLQNIFQGSDRLVKAKSDGSLASTGTTAPTDTSMSKLKSRSLEPLAGLAMWSSHPTIIELPKGERGLGFSILDYQDPMNPNETVIVIRSLVPMGVAQQDGRLIPGDRLLAVNDINLENATLDQAVQALKGAQRGIVRIAVAKPYPLADTTTISSTQSEETTPPPLPVSPPPGAEPLASPRTPTGIMFDTVDSTIDSLPPIPTYKDPTYKESSKNEIDLSNENQVTPLIPIATERLITSASTYYSSLTTTTSGADSSSSSTTVVHHDGVTSRARMSSELSNQSATLPFALEQTIKIMKLEEPLGINVELIDDGINGVMVTSVAVGGPFHRDGRIQAGDFLVTVNNESLRNVTNAQARAILRRAQLFSKDLSVCYIPASDAEVYRDSLRIQASAIDPLDSSLFPERNREISEATEEEVLVERRGSGTDVNVGLRSRTPADGQESIKATIATTSNLNSSTVITRKVSPIPFKSPESNTTVFINSSGGSDIIPPATQPTVQKRVVTHVTIFPSPPPDLVQLTRTTPITKPNVVTSTITSISGVGSGTTAAEEQLSEVEESHSLSASASASASVAPGEASDKQSRDSKGEELGSGSISATTPVVFSIAKPTRKGLTPSSSIENSTDMVGIKEPAGGLSSSEEQQTSRSTPTPKGGSGSGDESALLLAKHWGPERLVEVQREQGKSLGISIVGGKVDLYNAGPDSGSAISGIFIKNVLPNSPAGKTGQLKTGDRILAVDDVDLRSASHERAVDVIRAAGNPVRFLVQSLVQWADGRGIGVSIANHDDSEASERSEGTETKSQSYSQTVQSQSCSSQTNTGTTTDTTTGTETETGTTTGSESTANGNTQRRRSGGAGSGAGGGDSISEASDETTSQIERRRDSKTGVPVPGAGSQGSDDDEDDDEVQRLVSSSGGGEGLLIKVAPPPVTPARTPSPELIQPGLGDDEKQEIQAKMEVAASKPQGVKAQQQITTIKKESEESAHSSEEDDELGDDRQLQGKIRTKEGVEIDRASAGNVKRSKVEAENGGDSETEDEFGYTTRKIEKRWGEIARGTENGKIIIADLERSDRGLGISLAGDRDRMKMATYICGINPAGAAYRTRQLEVGDEILEVNGVVLYGRCHLNASALIKALPQNHVKIIAIRKTDGLEDLSVKPIVQFPVSLQSETPEEKYANYKGLRVVVLKKSGGGLGIMIIEGRHAELGQGIFISDIQEGSPAEQAGLFVGDMILAVNGEDMVGSDYEHAANTLKKADGNVILVVCNASKGKDEDTSKDKLLVDKAPPSSKEADVKQTKEPEKPKLPPKPSKIPSPSKLISSVSSSVISLRTKLHVSTPTLPVPTSTVATALSPVSPSSPSPTPSLASKILGFAHGISSSSTTSPSATSPTGTQIPPSTSGNLHPIVPTSVIITTPPSSTSPLISPSNIPSVIVKPSTPSPKLHSAIAPSSTSAAKMALLVKNRLEEPPADPVHCVINPGRETTIEINKDKMGLGLSIVGGSDTLLGSIIIHEVYPDGAAAKDGRLKPGDQLLSVNNEDFQNITHSKALAALRQTPMKVKMVVYRDETVAKEDDMYDVIEVELVKKSGKGLGLSIVGRKNGSGVFISDVVPGGIAELHGGLMKGDMIINVDGVDLKNATQEEAASVLKTAIGPIRMKIGRLKAAANRRSASSTPATVPATPTSDNKNDLGFSDEELLEVNTNTQNGNRNSNSNPPSLTGSPPQVKNIILERGPDGLGFSIVGGYGSPHGNLPIYVKTVFEKGAAIICGLKRGDQIIAVNSVACEGLTHQEAVKLLKNAKGNVAVTILT